MNGPVVVSGLGGSGTRVVAVICERLGVHMGRDLNDAHDNLLFTLLFKRPAWLAGLGDRRRPLVARALELFREVSFAPRAARRASTAAAFGAAALDQVLHGLERPTAPRRAAWTARRIRAAGAGPALSADAPWGWKEPTAHVYLDALVELMPGMRYLHVVRSPKDYATVPHNQPWMWGPLLKLSHPSGAGDLVEGQLRYWVEANQRALRIVEAASVAHLVLRLEEMTEDAVAAVQTIATFLDVELSAGAAVEMGAAIRSPTSIGRGRDLDVASLLDRDAVEFIDRIGYAV